MAKKKKKDNGDNNNNKPKVMHNFPGWTDVLNRPKTDEEKAMFIAAMVAQGRVHEIESHQIACMQFERSLSNFLIDVKTMDRFERKELMKK